jgi:hypothetical protein
LTYDFDAATTQKEKMKQIGRLWAEEKTSILDEEHYATGDATDHVATLAKKQKQGLAYKKLKKQKKSRRRATMWTSISTSWSKCWLC